MDIKHAKAILILGLPGCKALEVIKDLTNTVPTRTDAHSIAGLTHQWDVRTKYYNATIPIWVDEIADPEQWKAEFLKAEAKEVVEAVGAWLVCFTVQQTPEEIEAIGSMLEAIQEIVGEHSGYSNDSIMLAITSATSFGTPLSDDARGLWEDKTMEYGFELIDHGNNGRNEYGENQGIARVKEALIAHEWSMPIAGAAEDDGDGLEVVDIEALPLGKTELSSDMRAALISDQDTSQEVLDAKQAIDEEGAQATAVDDLDAMLGKLLAARERVADLPEEQRKKAAADAVRQLMSSDF